jgi:cardiolipin synthase
VTARRTPLALVLGLLLAVCLPRSIAETAPMSPQALTLGRLEAGGNDSGDAAVKIADFADTESLVKSLGADPAQHDLLARHLAVEEAIAGQPLTSGNKVQLLENGPNTYVAMFAALRAAKHSIHFESYIFDSDDTGRQFANLLLKKRQQGLEVALLVDAVGTVNDSADMFQKLRDGGVPVTVFHPLNPLHKTSQSYSPDMRDHRKLLVIDDSVGFTGGINISSVYSSAPSSRLLRRRKDDDDAEHSSWRDTHVELNGPAVAELQRLFLANWRAADGAPLASQQAGALKPVKLLQKASLPPTMSDAREVNAKDNGAPTDPGPLDQAVVRIISEDPAHPDGHEIYSTYLAHLATAQHSIDITMAYFVPDPRLMGILEAAARRGVDVKLVLPSFTDSWIVQAASRASYQPLLDAGVKIYERRNFMLHAKTAVVDGVWSTVGSSNLDWRSFDLNDEVNAVVLGPKFGQQMSTLFGNDVKHATLVVSSEWRQRALWERGREQLALLLQRWL